MVRLQLQEIYLEICLRREATEAQWVELYSHLSQHDCNNSITLRHLLALKLFFERQAWISHACFLHGSLLGCATISSLLSDV